MFTKYNYFHHVALKPNVILPITFYELNYPSFKICRVETSVIDCVPEWLTGTCSYISIARCQIILFKYYLLFYFSFIQMDSVPCLRVSQRYAQHFR